jgi:hypothetical protein
MKNDKDSLHDNHAAGDDEPPPFMGSWNRLYVAIVVYTCIFTLALYFMTVVLNR